MKKLLRWLPPVLFIIILIGMTILGKSYINKVTAHKIKLYNSRMTPTILIPGSSATQERFNSMLAQLNQMGEKHSVLKLTVKKDNSIIYNGQISGNDHKPYIVIGFENNEDGYSNIKKQTKWLQIAMNDLQKKYKFKRFNAIGHSNGGLSWTIFLEDYYDSDEFDMKSLLTMGTPFNFEESNTSNHTQMLKDLISNKGNIPSSLMVYNLAGTNSYDGDKIVPFASVETGKYIFQETAKHYTQLTVTGNNATHSDLPDNPEVIQYVAEKILKNEKGKLPKPH